MPNLSKSAYNECVYRATEAGRFQGIQEGKAQAWNSVKNEQLQARLKLLNQIGQAMEAQSRAMEYFTRTITAMEDLFK